MRSIYILLLALLVGVAGGQSNQAGLSDELKKLLQNSGKNYSEAMLKQAPDQATCTANKNQLSGDVQSKFTLEQRKDIKLPATGKLMGDWKKGEPIFNTLAQGNCFSCHLGSPLNLGGNVGPSLEKYGQRGTSEAIQKYTYEVIFNSWAYFPCTVMYRFGRNDLLKPEQIADVVAYLLDPSSDFNTKPALKK